MIHIDFSGISLKLKKDNGKTSVFDPVRKRWFVLTPEEHVRQHIIEYMLNIIHYPAALIAVEKSIRVGNRNKRFDIVVYDKNHEPWMLVECKAPEVEISEKTLHQLLNYQQTIRCRYWLLTNGHQTYCADAGDTQQIYWMASLPAQ